MRKTEITGTTKAIYDYLSDFTDKYGYPPSVRELCKAVNIKSTSTIFFHLEKLQKLGYIKKSASKNRAIEIFNRSVERINNVPLVGKVAAGVPILAVENIVEHIAVPSSLFSGTSLFFLTVQGDSMINAGILDGDLIAVNKQESAENGEIVVAMIDDEVTVKRFYNENGHIRLQPENDAYAPIIVNKDFSILGKVVGLLRKSV